MGSTILNLFGVPLELRMSELSSTFCQRSPPSCVVLELTCRFHPRKVDGHERCLVLVNHGDIK